MQEPAGSAQPAANLPAAVSDDSSRQIFKAYDVRGIYPDEIDESVAQKIGNAFAAVHRRLHR